MKNCNKNEGRRVTARAAVKQRLIEEGLINEALQVTDVSSINKINQFNTIWNQSAFKRFGVQGNLISYNDNLNSVVINTEMGRKIDAVKGIFYNENKYLQKYADAKRKEIEERKKKLQEEREFQEASEEYSAQRELDLFDELYELSNTWEYNGEIYPTKADMELAMSEDGVDNNFDSSFSASSTLISQVQVNPNVANVITLKTLAVKELDRKINNLKDKVKFEKENKGKIREEIRNLEDRRKMIQQEIVDINNSENLVDAAFASFNNDLNYLNTLLEKETPTLEEIHYADELISYFDSITDYSSKNEENPFIDTTDPSLIEDEIKEKLHEIRKQTYDVKTHIHKAKKKYLKEIISKSEKLKKLFPKQQEEEILEELLKSKKDISSFSMYFTTLDKDMSGDETLIMQLIRDEIDRARTSQKSLAANIIQKLNSAIPDADKELLKMGYGISGVGVLNSVLGKVSYDLFYQKNDKGQKTGRLISMFSETWFKDMYGFINKNNQDILNASLDKSVDSANNLNLAYARRFDWINSNANFLDLSLTPEIINNPLFKGFKSKYFANVDPKEAEQYKRTVISQIGESEYNNLVLRQTEQLEEFIERGKQFLKRLKEKHKVSNISDLDKNVLIGFEISQLRDNPFELLLSKKSGKPGIISYQTSKNTLEYTSTVKYNTFFPKKQKEHYDKASGIKSLVDSKYYDSDFKKVDNNPALRKLYEALSESAEFINSGLAGSDISLAHNSLLTTEKSFMDILFNKDTSLLNKLSRITKETGQAIKDTASAKKQKVSVENIVDVNKGNVQSVQDKATVRAGTMLQQLSVILGKKVPYGQNIKLSSLSPQQKESFLDLVGMEESDFKDLYGDTFPAGKTFRELSLDLIMKEQAFNLPVMMKAFVDSVSEFKAQKQAIGNITLLKSMAESVKKETKTKSKDTSIGALKLFLNREGRKEGVTDKRINSLRRMNHFIDKNVKGVENNRLGWTIGKNLNADEKEIEKSITEYLEILDEEIKSAKTAEEKEVLEAEKAFLLSKREDLGKVYSSSRVWDAVVNRFTILTGLGYNIKAQTFNRMQGWYVGNTIDGVLWSEGNFASANAFVNGYMLTGLPGNKEYKEEMKKCKLLIEKLNIITDATNEMDRARRGSSIASKTKILDPHYGTERVEWFNQTSQILAMLGDMEITDKNGNTKPAFDIQTKSFPAFKIEGGQIILKKEFRTPENIDTWENFTSSKGQDNKTRMQGIINLINGDYSKSGSTLAKSYAIGRTAMLFKTWAANYFILRYGGKQKRVDLGEEFEGIYRSAFNDPKTKSVVATAFVANQTAKLFSVAGGFMGVGGIVTMALGAGAIGTFAYNSIKHRNNPEVQNLRQAAFFLKGLIKHMVGIPVNLVSRKQIIKNAQSSKLNLSPQEIAKLNFIMKEVAFSLNMLLVRLLWESMQGGEEDEPKTLDGKNPNPAYYKQEESELKKQTLNLLINLTDRASQEVNLYASPMDMLSTGFELGGLESFTKKLTYLASGIIEKTLTGDDEIGSGINKGESKSFVGMKKMLPGLFTDIASGEFYKFGFGSYTKKEFNTSDLTDKYFSSDYKKDRATIAKERKEYKAALKDYLEEESGLDDIENPVLKKKYEDAIEKIAKQEMEKTFPYTTRKAYSEDQERKEEYSFDMIDDADSKEAFKNFKKKIGRE